MWIFSTIGFFSVVQKRGDDQLTVRARFPGDLEALRERYLPELGPTETTLRADYRYRARVSHAAFDDGIVRLVAAIDYDNFKAEVGHRQGHERADIYADVWSILYAHQR